MQPDKKPSRFMHLSALLGIIAAAMTILVGALQLADRLKPGEAPVVLTDEVSGAPPKIEQSTSGKLVSAQPSTPPIGSSLDIEPAQSELPPAPARAGWPVIVTISADGSKPDKTPWDEGTTLLDSSTAPDIILQINYDDGSSDILLGPNYQDDWLIHPWGGAARDLGDYPCMDKYACIITGELVKQTSFDVQVLEWDPALRPNQSTAEQIGTLHCTLKAVCRGAGVELTFKPI